MLQGPDVSSWQGSVDWAAVAASGRQFGWSKATEGVNYVNPTFAANWAAMRVAGLVRGAYHFAHPELNAATAEADYFLATVTDLQPGDLLALDLEAGSGNLLQWALNWLGAVTAKAGFRPLLYSGDWFLEPHGVDGSADLAQYGLWLSGYSATPPPLPPGFTLLAMWQHTDQAVVPGIAGPVDESYFFGTVDQLRAYGKPAPPSISVNDQLVTLLSVIGDMTYPDTAQWDETAPNQAVSRRVFQRQLVQHGKQLLGAK